MKKFYSFLIAAVALVGLAACESNVEQTPVQDGMMSFVASFDNTRTVLADETGVVAWCEEDTIAISNGVETKEFAISEILEDGSAVFTGERLDGEVFTAIYPYTEETEWTVATEQEAVAGSFAHGVAVSTAVSEDGKTLSFKNECAVLKFQVPATAQSVAFYNGEELVVEVVGEMTVDNNYYAVVMPGTYTFTVTIDGEVSKESTKALELEANKIYNLKALPEVVIPFEPVASEWAIVGAFNGWKDQALYTTEDSNIVVAEGVAMEAAQGFLVRKPSTDWADKYGAGDVNYIKANHYINAQKEGADMCLEAAGTYDIYFNISSKAIYVMVAGTDYTTAELQTVSGKEPVQEEPEVTEVVVYLKPNNNWKQSNARFAAYFFGGTTGEQWVSMTAVGDGTYECHLPEGYELGCNIIFCRMNPSTTANNWNNKWNQTSDLKTPTDGKNLYTVKENTWDKGGGSWSVK